MHTDLERKITNNKSDIDHQKVEFINFKQEELKEKQELVNKINKNDGTIEVLQRESDENKKEIEEAYDLIKYTDVIPILNEFGENIISKIPKNALGKLDFFIDAVMWKAVSERKKELKGLLKLIKITDKDTFEINFLNDEGKNLSIDIRTSCQL